MNTTKCKYRKTSGIKFTTADTLIEFDKLQMIDEKIDSILKGGFRTHILNEIVGCSGSGKTQICLVLALIVQLPKELGGFNKVAAYICTEDVFPIKRLHELSYGFQQKYLLSDFLDNVFISHISEYKKLEDVLINQLPCLSKIKDIGLIVIDSIAGVFRSDNLDISYENRSKQFLKIAMTLRQLADKLNCVVICTNQVTDNVKTGNTEPCLGLSWSNLVNSRFAISRKYLSRRREFEIIFAPDLPNLKCNFCISKDGIQGCED